MNTDTVSFDAALVREAIEAAEPSRRVEWLGTRAALEPAALRAQAAAYFGLEALTMEDLRGFEPDLETVGFADAQRRLVLVGRVLGDGGLATVVCDPTDRATTAWLAGRLRARRLVATCSAIALREDLLALLALLERRTRALDAVRVESAAAGAAAGRDVSLSLAGIDAASSPVVRLVDSTLHDALRVGASDIHLETSAQGLAIKYRIDGVLELVRQLPDPALAEQALSRVKVLAELDIAERRVPQDGRFGVLADGREIDFRVSIMPNLFGEDAVLRVLDRAHLTGRMKALTLDTLGFEPSVLAFVRRMAAQPYGLLLVTGPTGSGKTTTLYGVLNEINSGLDKIVTIEDPIEYQLPGILQIPVNEKKGLGFARGLRSILRHDPDKIMVGEIRDAETAQIAVQAALTGHQVFTTVHANNVFDVIGRFANMGVDAYNLVAALSGIVAQRLVRRCCRQCAAEAPPDAELLAASGLAGEAARGRWRRGAGCAACRGSGYSGRVAIAETLAMTDTLRELMVARAPVARLRQAAAALGFGDLRASALALARSGDTTLEEANRVTPSRTDA